MALWKFFPPSMLIMRSICSPWPFFDACTTKMYLRAPRVLCCVILVVFVFFPVSGRVFNKFQRVRCLTLVDHCPQRIGTLCVEPLEEGTQLIHVFADALKHARALEARRSCLLSTHTGDPFEMRKRLPRESNSSACWYLSAMDADMRFRFESQRNTVGWSPTCAQVCDSTQACCADSLGKFRKSEQFEKGPEAALPRSPRTVEAY